MEKAAEREGVGHAWRAHVSALLLVVCRVQAEISSLFNAFAFAQVQGLFSSEAIDTGNSREWEFGLGFLLLLPVLKKTSGD